MTSTPSESRLDDSHFRVYSAQPVDTMCSTSVQDVRLPAANAASQSCPFRCPQFSGRVSGAGYAYNTILRPRRSGFSCRAAPRLGPHRSSSTDEEKSKVVALHLKPSGLCSPPTMKSRDDKSIPRLLKQSQHLATFEEPLYRANDLLEPRRACR